jgi:ureidoglycolate amidohydrolase
VACFCSKKAIACHAAGVVDTVATVGSWHIQPNAVNSVPREAALEIDVRDIDGPRRDGVLAAIKAEAAAIAARRKVRLAVETINQDPPAACGAPVVAAVEAAVREVGASSKRMVSRAYHDSLFMAQIAPTGMVFIPCRNGWSHRPDEFAAPDDIQRGIEVLALALAQLAGDGSRGSGGGGGGSGSGARTEL